MMIKSSRKGDHISLPSHEIYAIKMNTLEALIFRLSQSRSKASVVVIELPISVSPSS